MKPLFILFTFSFLATATAAQDAPALTCRIWSDSLQTVVTPEEAAAWADNVPIRVGCSDGKVYTLSSYDISIFTRNPMQTRAFGKGEAGGIPVLARNAIDKLAKGDAFILKNAVYVDADGKEKTLPVISFSIE
jgi:hypothetical protein